MIPGSELSHHDSLAPLLVVTMPTLAALVVYRSSRPFVRFCISFGTTIATGTLLGWMALGLVRGRVHRFSGSEIVPNVTIELAADPLGLLFAITAVGVYLGGVVFTSRQLRRRHLTGGARIYACFMASQAGAIGAALAGNLLVLFFFLEVLTLTTYPLIAHSEDRASRRAGYTYLAYGFGGGMSVLIGTRVIFAEVNSITFVPGGLPALSANVANDPWLLRMAFFLLVVGLGTKAAIVPLHSWFVRARVTGTPIFGSVFAIVVLNAGMLGVFRIVLDLFGLSSTIDLGLAVLLLMTGVVTAAVAGTMAIAVERLRDRFAYLAIASGGVPLVGLTALEPVAQTVVIAFVPMYSAGLLVGFLSLAAIELNQIQSSLWNRHSHFSSKTLGLSSLWLIVLVGLVSSAILFLVYTSAMSSLWLLLATAALLVTTLSHAMGLWPALLGLYRSTKGREQALDITRYPTTTGWTTIDVVVEEFYRGMAAVGVRGELIAVKSMYAIRYPNNAIERSLPTTVVPWYRNRRWRTMGMTGVKLSTEGSIYVIVTVLTFVLIVGLR